MPDTTESLWKRKLAAYLHDPPSKAPEARAHEARPDFVASLFAHH